MHLGHIEDLSPSHQGSRILHNDHSPGNHESSIVHIEIHHSPEVSQVLEARAALRRQNTIGAVFHSECQERVYRVLHKPFFDYALGAIILFNFIIIIVETDAASKDGSEDAQSWTAIGGWVTMVVFLVELMMRLYAYRSRFWVDPWNTFDFVVVVVDTFFGVLSVLLGNLLPVSSIRIFRLCKVARVSKVLRVFPELRLLVAGLMGSIKAIFWGTVLLVFVLLVWSIIAVQIIHPLNQELARKDVYADCPRCSRAYSTVWHSTLTFTQQIVTGDSWGQATIPLIENYPGTAVYFMGVFLSVGMAVLNLILGVVVNVASQERDNLKEEIENEKRIQRMEVQNHLLDICRLMDTDGSGTLSKEELLEGYHEREDFRKTIMDMDLNAEDIDILWNILDVDRTGKVSFTDFVSQVYKMRSSDTQFMLASIKYYVALIKNKILEQMEATLGPASRMVSRPPEAGSPNMKFNDEGYHDTCDLAVYEPLFAVEAAQCSPHDKSNGISKAENEQRPSLRGCRGLKPLDVANLQAIDVRLMEDSRGQLEMESPLGDRGTPSFGIQGSPSVGTFQKDAIDIGCPSQRQPERRNPKPKTSDCVLDV